MIIIKPKGVSFSLLATFVISLQQADFQGSHEILIKKENEWNIHSTKKIKRLYFILNILSQTYKIGKNDTVIIRLQSTGENQDQEDFIRTLKYYMSEVPENPLAINEDIFIPVDTIPTISERPKHTSKGFDSRRVLFADKTIYTTGLSSLDSGVIGIKASSVYEKKIELALKNFKFRFILLKGTIGEELILPFRELWDDDKGILYAIEERKRPAIKTCPKCEGQGVDRWAFDQCNRCSGSGYIDKPENMLEKIDETVTKTRSNNPRGFSMLKKEEDIPIINVTTIFSREKKYRSGDPTGGILIHTANKKSLGGVKKNDRFITNGIEKRSNPRYPFGIKLAKINEVGMGVNTKYRVRFVPEDKYDKTLPLAHYLMVFTPEIKEYDIID